jgi:hypothetical protein
MSQIQQNIVRLAADLVPASGSEKERIANLIWYSGATVKRQSWDGAYMLTLSLNAEHVRMDRLASGKAPLLNSHRDYDIKDIIGIIEKADLSGHARVRFSNREDVTPIWNDVQDGIIRNASVGAAIHQLKDVSKEDDRIKSYLAVDWEPMEVSLLPIGADPNAGLAAEGDDQLQQLRADAQKGSKKMSETINAGATAGVTNQDMNQIREIGLATHLPNDFIEGAIAGGITLENARTLFINELARRSETEAPICSHHAELVTDRGDTMRLQMEDALFSRMTGKAPSERGREYSGVRLSDMARDLMLSRGIRVSSRNPSEIVKLAITHTTSDFPILLAGTGQRALLAAYQAAQAAIKTVCRQSTAGDFRAKYALRLGEAPKLIKVPESGELTYGTRAEVAESYRCYTYGRIFSLSREGIINDDLGAFNDFVSAFGQSAASLEAQIIVDLLALNSGAGPTMSDSKALFHTDHGNLASSGATISDTTLGAARLALRTATGIDGETIISAAPRYLLIPAALETPAEKYLATLYPAQASNVNPFAGGKLELLVEPRLDTSIDEYGWYVFADPAVAPVLEYAYLEGFQGPQVESRTGWETLGVEFRCFEDFGAGAIGYRGAYSNAGH